MVSVVFMVILLLCKTALHQTEFKEGFVYFANIEIQAVNEIYTIDKKHFFHQRIS